MRVHTFHLQTSEKYQIIDITSNIERLLSQSKTTEGACLIFTPHATAAIFLEENEPGLTNDFVRLFKNIGERNNWEHDQIDDNAAAHLLSGIIGQSCILPISEGKLVRGTWQQILFVELDGPRRSRSVCIQFLRSG